VEQRVTATGRLLASSLPGIKVAHKLYLSYSTSFGERVHGVATLPSGARDIHLYFYLISNQHYTYAPGAFCYALSTAGTSTASQPLVRSLQLVEV